MNEEAKSKHEPLSPVDTPEHYAKYYLLPPEDVELFEKVKTLHDYIQEKNIPLAIVGAFPISGKQCLFYHLHNKQGEQEKANMGLAKIIWAFDDWIKWMTGDHIFVSKR